MTVREFLFYVVEKEIDLETDVLYDDGYNYGQTRLPTTVHREDGELILYPVDLEKDRE